MRWFEDFHEGQEIDLGQVRVEEAEVLEFARRYDPQPFHTDPVAAADGPFGGLIASGWHTAALYMRRYVDVVLSDAASMGSPGMELLRWEKPVRPGTTLHCRLTVLAATPSERHPARGTLRLRSEAFDDDGDRVLVFEGRGLFGRRPVDDDPQRA